MVFKGYKHQNSFHYKANGLSVQNMTRSGDIENLIQYNEDDNVDSFEISNGARGCNGNSRHVCLIGGWSKDGDKNGLFEFGSLYTLAQLNSIVYYIQQMIENHRDIKIGGHNLISSKTCPNFDVVKFLKDIGINEKNILNLT